MSMINGVGRVLRWWERSYKESASGPVDHELKQMLRDFEQLSWFDIVRPYLFLALSVPCLFIGGDMLVYGITLAVFSWLFSSINANRRQNYIIARALVASRSTVPSVDAPVRGA